MPNLIYATGTVAIGAGAVSVAGAGGPLWASNVQQFDKLLVDGFAGVDILGVTDDTHLVIAKWPFAAVPAGTKYQILQTSPLRFNGAQNSAEVIRLTGALEADGFYIFVRADQAGPDPSKGDEGQYARQPATGKEWYKSGGVWTFVGVSKPLGDPAPYDNARVYSLMDVATANGSSYVWINATPGSGHAPPDPTYWVLLASKGDTGATGPLPWLQTVAWATGQNYVVGPPASIVVHPINKNIYQCVVPHLSGTFATDLAAGKWLLIGQSATEATSATALAIGTGTKVFSAVTGFSYQNGVRLRASSNASPSNWMEGVCLYDPLAQIITMTADKANGAGTFGDWNFNRVGQPGAGDLTSSLNLAELTNKPAAVVNLGIPPLLRGLPLAGLKITSTGIASFSVSAGVACDRNQLDMITLGAPISKAGGAWNVGNGNGGLDTGAMATGLYHVFVIRNPTGSGSIDVLYSLSATAPTLPGGYTQFRRIGAVYWNGSVFLQILQRGREFWWPGIALDMDTALGTTLQTFALGSVPPGVQVQAILTVIGWATAINTQWWVHDVAAVDAAPNYANGATGGEVTSASMGGFAEIRVWTDTSRRIAARASAAGVTLRIITRGWYDPFE
ncbi:hypothetical protein HU230_0014025 [Bradyrhizobium quebecense]|uniref:Uncharacterized protein n=1 Tax=Bradyrhizobium quebecense TaxID=2748629 RepID=A0A973WM40_9BRAD|nr:hypothetical protein [Bradyrhizobium quebecense]UGA47089.1 hypothetical protein HU230_0014025 [Bradyrhizobium quebecense]